MTLSVTIDQNGITAPTYDFIYTSLQNSMRSIFGSDIVLDPDSQDGQMLAIFALAIHDSNQAVIAAYQSFSPSTAQGVGLASVVKINGLTKLSASQSAAIVRIVGEVGTIITNGIVEDLNQHQWALPSTVTIPIAGQIDVTALAVEQGSVEAAANTITKIVTPARGWQTVNNPSSAATGAPVETDSQLRQRQSVSTSLPALSVLDAIIGSIANLPGVERYKGYENDTGAPDGDGIAAHSIAMVVEGGNVTDIVNTIAQKKTPGTGTVGTTSQTVIDQKGVPNTIRYYALTPVPITVQIDVTALSTYVAPTGTTLKQAVADYINALAIGEDVYWHRLIGPATFDGDGLGRSFDLTGLRISRAGPPAAANVVIAFNEAATCDVANITLTVT